MGGAQPPPSGYTAVRRRRRWPWVLFAIAIALGLGVEALVGVGIYTAIRQIGRASCLPSDFPAYRGATTTGLHVYSGTSGSSCDMVFDSTDPASTVTDFYTSQLNQGNWEIVSANAADGTIMFERRSDPGVHGELRILGRGIHSTFEVVVEAG